MRAFSRVARTFCEALRKSLFEPSISKPTFTTEFVYTWSMVVLWAHARHKVNTASILDFAYGPMEYENGKP